MKTVRATLSLCLLLLLLGPNTVVLAQNKDLSYNKRDPFVPLLDDKGNLRKDFNKPSLKISLPKLNLMGITKVGGIYYAMIDGELLKEGQIIKDVEIKKVEQDRVIVHYGENDFELKWGTGK